MAVPFLERAQMFFGEKRPHQATTDGLSLQIMRGPVRWSGERAVFGPQRLVEGLWW